MPAHRKTRNGFFFPHLIFLLDLIFFLLLVLAIQQLPRSEELCHYLKVVPSQIYGLAKTANFITRIRKNVDNTCTVHFV